MVMPYERIRKLPYHYSYGYFHRDVLGSLAAFEGLKSMRRKLRDIPKDLINEAHDKCLEVE